VPEKRIAVRTFPTDQQGPRKVSGSTARRTGRPEVRVPFLHRIIDAAGPPIRIRLHGSTLTRSTNRRKSGATLIQRSEKTDSGQGCGRVPKTARCPGNQSSNPAFYGIPGGSPSPSPTTARIEAPADTAGVLLLG